MKIYIKLIVLLFTLVLASCQDVIDIDVQTAPSRLVIEASLDWEKGTNGNNQTIKLSESTPYFDTNTKTNVVNATVSVTNNNTGEEFVFTHQGNGIYSTSNFQPIVNHSYSLLVLHEGERYTAQEVLTTVADLTGVTQSREEGFDDEELEVNVIFNDPEDEENYYLIKFHKRGELLPVLEDGNDEFVNGNEITWWFEDEVKGFVPGESVDITLYGISEDYHNYMRILIEQSEEAGPFSTTPVPLRGNCINESNPDRYAFGYFRVTQVVKASYTFQ